MNTVPACVPQDDAARESGGVQGYVYFPTSCIVSLLYVLENGSSAEIAIVGCEGLGLFLLVTPTEYAEFGLLFVRCRTQRAKALSVSMDGSVHTQYGIGPRLARMLHTFLTTNRADLTDRCRLKVAQRRAPKATDHELAHGIPLFLDQLIKTLRVEQTPNPMQSRLVSGPSGGGNVSEISETARLHGRELLGHGFTVDQVVHDYGDLCQAITDLAFERAAPVSVDEFRTLNRCLDNAIAGAVMEFDYQRDLLVAEKGVQALNERLGFLAHELRNLIQTATLAVTAIKSGNVGLAGATGAVLDRSLIGLRNLIDRSLADVRVTAGMPPRSHPIRIADLIAEIKISASLEAQAHGCGLHVSRVDPELAVEADRDLLLSALGNLLQNAFKFTEAHTDVALNVRAGGDRVLIEVEDRCGGLHPGDAESFFQPFAQTGSDRSGLGLGLSICRRSVEANHGRLTVRDLPGTGCIFTIDLPQRVRPQPGATAA